MPGLNQRSSPFQKLLLNNNNLLVNKLWLWFQILEKVLAFCDFLEISYCIYTYSNHQTMGKERRPTFPGSSWVSSPLIPFNMCILPNKPKNKLSSISQCCLETFSENLLSSFTFVPNLLICFPLKIEPINKEVNELNGEKLWCHLSFKSFE